MTRKKEKGPKKHESTPEEMNLYIGLAVFLVGLFNATLFMVTGVLRFLRKEGGSFAGRLLGLLLFGYLYIFLAERRPAMYTALFIAWVVGCFVIAGFQAYGDSRSTKKRKKAKKKNLERGDEGQYKVDLTKHEPECFIVNDHEDPGEGREEVEAARRESHLRIVRQIVEFGAAGKLAGPNKQGEIVPVTGRGARLVDVLRGLNGVAPSWERADLLALLAECGIRYKKQMKFQVDGEPANEYGINVTQLREDLGLNPRQKPAYQVPDNTHTGPSRALAPTFSKGPPGGDQGRDTEGAA
ncbi:hypothetical protein [Streptomyces noursei]|uniref:hypothetical protein n=1 Tax=Streptomyces noursei TaxID=1971 RepID=UPI0037F3DE51